MSEPTGWRKTLQEPNAIGWIGLIVVVLAIGVGALYVRRRRLQTMPRQHAAPVSTGQAVK